MPMHGMAVQRLVIPPKKELELLGQTFQSKKDGLI